MEEIYYLNKEMLPTIPVPHDCVIKEIKIEDQFIVFIFEDDISYHDSITKKDARSLIIKYHLVDEDSFSLYKWKKSFKLFSRKASYECINNSKLIKISDGNLEYLYHNVGYCSIIIKLYSGGLIILDADVDYLEYEWIE